jgi:hypothetical protein
MLLKPFVTNAQIRRRVARHVRCPDPEDPHVQKARKRRQVLQPIWSGCLAETHLTTAVVASLGAQAPTIESKMTTVLLRTQLVKNTAMVVKLWTLMVGWTVVLLLGKVGTTDGMICPTVMNCQRMKKKKRRKRQGRGLAKALPVQMLGMAIASK